MDHSAVKYRAREIGDYMSAVAWLTHVAQFGGSEEAKTASGASAYLEDQARQSFAKLADAMGYTIAAKPAAEAA